MEYENYGEPICTVETDGTKKWMLDDKLHRVDGPAIYGKDGYQAWWINGEKHRVDGPAVIRPGVGPGDVVYQAWWVHNKKHRVDGPAVEYSDGHKEWWWEGKKVDPMLHFILRGEISVDTS